MFSLLLHGVRSWKNAKGIAVLCIAALTIGIGSSTAIYTVIHAVLLNPLPYSNPERYFLVYRGWHTNPERQTVYSYPAAMETAQRARSTDAFGCVSSYVEPDSTSAWEDSPSTCRAFIFPRRCFNPWA